MEIKRISVCMATYNGEKYIQEQVNSIIEQLGPDDEIIISDDGSDDETVGIVQGINDFRIKLLHSKERNIVRNFENALKHAKGQVIFLSDQDDIWMPGKVETYLDHLKDCDLVFSNLSVFDKDVSKARLLYTNSKRRTGILNNLVKNNCVGATMAFNRKVLSEALPFPSGIYMHDIWLLLVAELKGSTKYLNEPFIYYRRHSENASRTGEKSTNGLLKKLLMRVRLVWNLMRRFS